MRSLVLIAVALWASPATVEGGVFPLSIDSRATVNPATTTLPIVPAPLTPSVDTPPGAQPESQTGQPGARVSEIEYEGWRQYSVNCARCHGQDVLPNPVAANLLVSLGAGGPIDAPDKFVTVVSKGRPHRGMPAFQGVLSPEQIQAVYAYVKGRADKRIPPGRPSKPT